MKRLRLGILDLVPIIGGAGAAEAIGHTVRLAQTAERLGFTRYWVAEHHDMPAIASSSPEVLLAHIGAKTESIRIGSGAVLLPYYKPYKVAETFHMLATLYPGRIDLGIGRAPGASAHASMALSDNYLQQVHRLPQSIQALSELLADDFRVEQERVSARPVPERPPELWLLGTGVKSANYAAAYGTGYVFGHFMSEEDGVRVAQTYADSFQPSRLCSSPRIIVAVSVICAETDEKAAEYAAQGAKAYLGAVAAEAGEQIAARMAKSVIGSPERIREKLLELSEQYNADELLIVTRTPDYESRMRSYELLAAACIDF
ncbi:LLM class flavin-dependent oxidoreductase [Paenibacillus ginsengarvi]|uniref:LLM class flavin-dependent oxidoreductase n=1 Tax=Paenibacillus ginsengarvi TaxID=400777 RepID=A0A3B0CGG8_9BACL|nr:LLM class flavin-dependent oxidoreductase [Paenibacillus ginsengarvi]RKN84442.1 LLM class flavin-dependent oxidoreductase [Paenibacillus ginsengarvi]